MNKRIAILLAGVALAATLAGCSTAEGEAHAAAITPPASGQTPDPSSKYPGLPFKETEKAGDMNVTLTIDPADNGKHHLVALTDDKNLAAAEAQVIMAGMGHGTIIDLQQTAPGRWETTTDAMAMGGGWVIRIKTTQASNVEQAALFRVQIKS